MSIVSNLVSGYRGFRAEVGGAPAPWDDFWYGPVGMGSGSGMRITPETVKRLSTVIACVSVKAKSMGVMPCLIFTDLAGGGKRVVKEHPYFDLLRKRPNSIQSAFDFYQMLQGHIELRGNGFAEILTDSRGRIGELVPMHPDHVKVEMLSNGRLRYRYNDPLTNSIRVLLQDEVLHVRDWADHRAVGQSRISMGADVYGVALAQQDFRGKYFKNDASTGVIITGTHFENKAAEEQYLKAFEEGATGEKRHRAKLLPPGVDIKSLGVSPTDMQLLEASKASAVEICTMHSVLPHLIGVDTGRAATYASVEQFNLMHAQQCVLPMAVMWEQALDRDVIDDERFYTKFSLAAFLRADFATRMQGYAVAIEHGWLSDDDVRELEDLNPIEGGIGKQYFRPMNWTTLDAKVLPAKQASQPAEAQDDDTEDDQDIEDPGEGEEQQQARGETEQFRAAQLELLVHDSAARCTRREVNAVRRLIEAEDGASQIAGFYLEHHRFVCDALHLRPAEALNLKQIYEDRSGHLRAHLDQDDRPAARALLEQAALISPKILANLAVKGVL